MIDFLLAQEAVTIDGVSAVAALAIGAFAVDRFATAFQFLLSLLPTFRSWAPKRGSVQSQIQAARSVAERSNSVDPLLIEAERDLLDSRNLAIYYFFAVIGAILVATLGDMEILSAVGFKHGGNDSHELFDTALTILILTGGADRIAALLQLSGATPQKEAESKPLEVQGTLTLVGNELRVEKAPNEEPT